MAELDDKKAQKTSTEVARLMRGGRVLRRFTPEEVRATNNPDEVIDLESYGRGGVLVRRERGQVSEAINSEVVSLSNLIVQRFVYRHWNNFSRAARFFESILDPDVRNKPLPDGDLFVINETLMKRIQETRQVLDAEEEELRGMYGKAALPKSSRTERVSLPIMSTLDRQMMAFVLQADRLASLVEGLYLAGDLGFLMEGKHNRNARLEKINSALYGFCNYLISAYDRMGPYLHRKHVEQVAEEARLRDEAAKEAERQRRERELKRERREYARRQAEERAKAILDERQASQLQEQQAEEASSNGKAESAPDTTTSDSDTTSAADTAAVAVNVQTDQSAKVLSADDTVPGAQEVESAQEEPAAAAEAQPEGNDGKETASQADIANGNADAQAPAAAEEPLPLAGQESGDVRAHEAGESMSSGNEAKASEPVSVSDKSAAEQTQADTPQPEKAAPSDAADRSEPAAG